MEINSASFGVVADLTVKAEIDANWDPPGTYGGQGTHGRVQVSEFRCNDDESSEKQLVQ